MKKLLLALLLICVSVDAKQKDVYTNYLTKESRKGKVKQISDVIDNFKYRSKFKEEERQVLDWLESLDLKTHIKEKDNFFTIYKMFGEQKRYVEFVRKGLKEDSLSKKEKATLQTILGYCYFYGEGVSKEYKKAFEFLKSARDIYPLKETNFLLGLSYLNGLGIQKNIEEARKHLNQILYAKKSNLYPKAYYLLGLSYLGEDLQKAQEYFEKNLKNDKVSTIDRYRYLYEYLLVKIANMSKPEQVGEVMFYLLRTSLAQAIKEEKRAFKLYEEIAELGTPKVYDKSLFGKYNVGVIDEKRFEDYHAIEFVTYQVSKNTTKKVFYQNPMSRMFKLLIDLDAREKNKKTYPLIYDKKVVDAQVADLRKKAIDNFKKIFKTDEEKYIFAYHTVYSSKDKITLYKDGKKHGEEIIFKRGLYNKQKRIKKYFFGEDMDRYIFDKKNYDPKKLQTDIDKGLDINYQNSKGVTMLMVTAYNVNTEAVKVLLKNGADLHIKDNNGHSVAKFLEYKTFKAEKYKEIRELIQKAVDKK